MKKSSEILIQEMHVLLIIVLKYIKATAKEQASDVDCYLIVKISLFVCLFVFFKVLDCY